MGPGPTNSRDGAVQDDRSAPSFAVQGIGLDQNEGSKESFRVDNNARVREKKGVYFVFFQEVEYSVSDDA